MTATLTPAQAYRPPWRPPAIDHLEWRPIDEVDETLSVMQEELPFEAYERVYATPLGLPDADDFGRRPTATDDLPEPTRFAARLGIAFLEIAAGSRSAPQVMRYCSPEVFDSLVRRQNHLAGRARTRQPVRLRRARVCHVRDSIVEATVIVQYGRRVRPVALRMEGLDGRWIVTEMLLG